MNNSYETLAFINFYSPSPSERGIEGEISASVVFIELLCNSDNLLIL